MKLYLTYSEKLTEEKLKVIQSTLANMDLELLIRNIPPGESQSDKQNKALFQQNLKLIKKADIIVAELSYEDTAVGYEVAYALEQRKPTVILYNSTLRNLKSSPLPPHISDNNSKYIVLKEYEFRTAYKSIELGLRNAKMLLSNKFILIIPHEIDQYLEWCVKERGMPKAAATREALKLVMRESPGYKEYLYQNQINKEQGAN